MQELAKEDLFPGLQWYSMGDGCEWTFYKHSGMRTEASEGDSSRIHILHGCLKYTDVPTVVQARYYRCLQTQKWVSAVFSYPNGIGLVPEYFWEIYPVGNGDIERFTGEHSEENMEKAVKAILLAPLYC